MGSDTVREIIKGIKPLADKIGQGAEHLYTVYVRQSYVDGIGYLLAAAVLTLLGIFVYTMMMRWISDPKNAPGSYDTGLMSRKMFATFGLTFWVFVMTLFAASGVKHLINPEYYAIQKIVCQAKGDGTCN